MRGRRRDPRDRDRYRRDDQLHLVRARRAVPVRAPAPAGFRRDARGRSGHAALAARGRQGSRPGISFTPGHHRAPARMERRRPQVDRAEGTAGHDLGRRLRRRRIPRARLPGRPGEPAPLARRSSSSRTPMPAISPGSFPAGSTPPRVPSATPTRTGASPSRQASRPGTSCSFPTSWKNSTPHALPVCERPWSHARRNAVRRLARIRAWPISMRSRWTDGGRAARHRTRMSLPVRSFLFPTARTAP